MSHYYKVLKEDGSAIYGTGKWFLPENGSFGKWMPKISGPLVECERGYHLCRRDDLLFWLGPSIYTAECRGPVKEGQDMVIVHEARLIKCLERWTESTARLFACDCAERAWSSIDKPDNRSMEAITVARRFASGQATPKELRAARTTALAAALDAAGGAAGAAVWGAAGGTVGAAWTAALAAAGGTVWTAVEAAKAAAWTAAWGAAGGTVWGAAGGTAGAAVRRWQTQRLFEYLNGNVG